MTVRTHSVEPSLFSMQAGCVAVSKRHAEQRRRVHTPGTGMQHMPLHMLMNGIPSSLTHPTYKRCLGKSYHGLHDVAEEDTDRSSIMCKTLRK